MSRSLRAALVALVGFPGCLNVDVILGGRGPGMFVSDAGPDTHAADARAADAAPPFGGLPGSGGSSGGAGGTFGARDLVACPREAAPHAGSLFQGPYIAIGDLAVDATHVYLKASDCCDRPPGYVLRVPLAGGAGEIVHASARYHTGVVVDDTYAHWTSQEGLKTLTKATSVVTVIPDVIYDALALHGGRIYGAGAGRIASHGEDGLRVHAQGDFAPDALVVDGRGVYFTNKGALGQILFVPAAGGSAAALVPGRGAGGDLAADAERLYFGASLATGPAGLVSVRKNDGAAMATLAAIRDLAGLAIDATHIYFTTSGSPCARSPAGNGQMAGTLVRVPKAGGPVVELARGLVAPGKVAVDATHVYFVAGSNQDHYRALHRRPK